jgi:ABC-type lipoprotein export system ATPase subunit
MSQYSNRFEEELNENLILVMKLIYALKEINLRYFYKNEYVALMGPSGSGKSTLNEYFRLFRYTKRRTIFFRR